MVLLNVSASLVQLRKYDLAQAMINAAVRIASSPELRNRADLVGRLKTWESVALPKDDPRSPVQQMLATFFNGTFSEETVRALFSKRLNEDLSSESEIADLNAEMSGVQQAFAAIGLEAEGLSDFMMSLIQYEKDGDDERGYRINTTAMGAPMPVMYVTREEGNYRIVGVGPDGYESIATLVLELLERGNVKDAQWWLDKVLEDMNSWWALFLLGR